MKYKAGCLGPIMRLIVLLGLDLATPNETRPASGNETDFATG
jgi:hypothetical protein